MYIFFYFKTETKDGATPLTRACANGHIETALILVEMGADLTHKDKTNRTPLDYIADPIKRENFEKAIDSYKALKAAKALETSLQERQREEAMQTTTHTLSREM
jgi:ankyrin repeat protein